MNEIGIMQGRLSPPPGGRIQAFPWGSWRTEFGLARECGFDSIEWLFESDNFDRNPLWTDQDLTQIVELISESGVQVRSVCADYFMPHPFFRVSDGERLNSIAILEKLIERASLIGVETILLPILEISEVRTESEKVMLLESLRTPLDIAWKKGIRLGLETELPVVEYMELVQRANHPALGVYFDVGNATAAGYDAPADIRGLAPHLCGVHIKDRKRHGGGTVLLGQGDTDFTAFFRSIAEIKYEGRFILQTAFGDDYCATARTHLTFVQQHITAAVVKAA